MNKDNILGASAHPQQRIGGTRFDQNGVEELGSKGVGELRSCGVVELRSSGVEELGS